MRPSTTGSDPTRGTLKPTPVTATGSRLEYFSGELHARRPCHGDGGAERHLGLRGVPEEGGLVGAAAHVRGLRAHRLLRRLAEQPCDRPLPRDRASDHPLRRARRGLVVVLRRRSRVRAPLMRWPALPYDEWTPTRDKLHMQLQVLGKIRLALSPLEPEWVNVPLYVTARGLWTSTIP